ncbi:MAG: AAA family ATPase [Chloroflexi bacterium]|nr:AAA family ATPase [Chloroflexota bacterium]
MTPSPANADVAVQTGHSDRAGSGGNGTCPTCGLSATSWPHDGTSHSGERRRVAVLFADLQGFTAICERSDAEDVIDLLNTIYGQLLDATQATGAHLDKILGDGIMLLFGAPRTHEDDALRAVRAALAMQETMPDIENLVHTRVGQGIKLRIGISFGEVVWGTVGPESSASPTVIGDAVNVAARLQHEAPPGGIVVSPRVYEQTRHYVQYRAHAPVVLHGKSDPMPYYEVYGWSSRSTEAKPRTLFQVPFVNRARELNILQSAWRETVKGIPQVVTMVGETGIGKSRLLAEFLSTIEDANPSQKALVLETNANRFGTSPYSPMVELLRSLLGVKDHEHHAASRIKIRHHLQSLHLAADEMMPILGYLLGWAAKDARLRHVHPQRLRQQAFGEATRIMLSQAQVRPTILVADDWQSAVPHSLEMVQGLLNELTPFLEKRGPALFLMLIIASRPGSNLEQLHRLQQPFHDLELKPLSQQASTQLVSQLVDESLVSHSLISALAIKSGGNPFYLVEGARSLVSLAKQNILTGGGELDNTFVSSMIPDSVQGLVTARIDSLSGDARIVLQYASVIGIRFRREVLAALEAPCQSLDESLHELVSRGLIRETRATEDEHVYRFVYDLVREVAYGMLLRKTRERLHEKIALFTEEVKPGADKEEIASLARHFLSSGNLPKAAGYSASAGMLALAHFSYDEAYQFLGQALTLMQESTESESETLHVQEALADACTFTGRSEEAIKLYHACLENRGTPEQQLALEYKLGRAYFYRGDVQQAYAHYRKASTALAGDERAENPWIARAEAEIALMFDRV